MGAVTMVLVGRFPQWWVLIIASSLLAAMGTVSVLLF